MGLVLPNLRKAARPLSRPYLEAYHGMARGLLRSIGAHDLLHRRARAEAGGRSYPNREPSPRPRETAAPPNPTSAFGARTGTMLHGLTPWAMRPEHLTDEDVVMLHHAAHAVEEAHLGGAKMEGGAPVAKDGRYGTGFVSLEGEAGTVAGSPHLAVSHVDSSLGTTSPGGLPQQHAPAFYRSGYKDFDPKSIPLYVAGHAHDVLLAEMQRRELHHPTPERSLPMHTETHSGERRASVSNPKQPDQDPGTTSTRRQSMESYTFPDTVRPEGRLRKAIRKLFPSAQMVRLDGLRREPVSKPYPSVSDLPQNLRDRLPAHAQEIMRAAFNAALDEYKGDEQRAWQTAWAAVKTKYRQDEKGEWIAKAASPELKADEDMGFDAKLVMGTPGAYLVTPDGYMAVDLTSGDKRGEHERCLERFAGQEGYGGEIPHAAVIDAVRAGLLRLRTDGERNLNVCVDPAWLDQHAARIAQLVKQDPVSLRLDIGTKGCLNATPDAARARPGTSVLLPESLRMAVADYVRGAAPTPGPRPSTLRPFEPAAAMHSPGAYLIQPGGQCAQADSHAEALAGYAGHPWPVPHQEVMDAVAQGLLKLRVGENGSVNADCDPAHLDAHAERLIQLIGEKPSEVTIDVGNKGSVQTQPGGPRAGNGDKLLPAKLRAALDAYEKLPAQPHPEVAKASGRFLELIEKAADQRLVTGIVLEPGDPSHVDAQGDWMRPEEIAEAQQRYMRRYRAGDVTIFTRKSGQRVTASALGRQHEKAAPADVSIVECYIAPEDLHIGGKLVRKGSWVMTTYIGDDALWRDIKSGAVTGYSVGGRGTRVAGGSGEKHSEEN